MGQQEVPKLRLNVETGIPIPPRTAGGGHDSWGSSEDSPQNR